MSQHRWGYVIGLGVAVAALVGSAGWAGARVAGDSPVTAAAESFWNGTGNGPGMMGRGSSGAGMMGSGRRWSDDGDGSEASVTLAQARRLAQQWVDAHAAGAAVDAGIRTPMGYRFVVTRQNQLVAMVMVDDDTGRLFAHGWNDGSPAVVPGAPTT